MALSGTCIIDVRNGGSDTANGGLFNPGATLDTTLAAMFATSSQPVVASASYTFIAGDVGAWLFVKSGTNWTPGWYQIASVSAGAATLSAGIGQAVLYTQGTASGLNTVVGCATTTSPTSGAWAVDYSQKTTAQFSLTGLTTLAASAIIATTAATVAMIGNGLVITGGTNFTTGYYQINAASAGVSLTVDRTCTSAAGAGGTAGLGGGFASPGAAGAVATVTGMVCFVLYNSSAYVFSSASLNISGGCVTVGNNTIYCGWATSRFLFNKDTNQPTCQIGSGVSSAVMFATGAGWIVNIILDGNAQTSSRGSSMVGGLHARCIFKNFTNGGSSNGSSISEYCIYTGCSSVLACAGTACHCESFANTVTSFGGLSINCLAYANTGATTDGFFNNGAVSTYVGCVAYGNGRNGFNSTRQLLVNCIAEANGGFGFVNGGGSPLYGLINCGSYNNTSGRSSLGSGPTFDTGAIQYTGSAFVNAAAGNFALNNTAGAGALLRAAGFPSLFPAGLTANYADVGAAQHQDAGGSSGVLYMPGMSGGMES